MSAQNHVRVSNNHFPWFSSTAVIFVLACEQRFRSCMAFSIYEVVRFACQYSVPINYATDKRRERLRKR